MRALIHALALFALTGCASGYAPSSITGGFDQRQINETVWQVGYYGNGYTTDETVQTYWLHRSAELAIEQGYDGFQIVSNIELTSAGEGESGAAILVPIVERPMGGHPYMVGQIRLLRAPLPSQGRYVFDARVLRDFLAPYVRGERCGGNVCPHVHRYLFPGFGEPS
jgi:hypothetical protein